MNRPDALDYEHDERELQGPYYVRGVTPDLSYAKHFTIGFCPLCLSRLSWNRTYCFADEDEDQCMECLVVWREEGKAL